MNVKKKVSLMKEPKIDKKYFKKTLKTCLVLAGRAGGESQEEGVFPAFPIGCLGDAGAEFWLDEEVSRGESNLGEATRSVAGRSWI